MLLPLFLCKKEKTDRKFEKKDRQKCESLFQTGNRLKTFSIEGETRGSNLKKLIKNH